MFVNRARTLKAMLTGRQYLSIADQIMLSLASLIASYLLLANVGVEVFGLYSFLIVVCNLISGSFGSVLHGQMTLRIAGKRVVLIKSNFLSTFVLYLCLFGLFSALLGTVLFALDSIPYFEGNKKSIIAAMVFSFLLSMFDLFRKYTYVMDKQEISLVSTTIYFLLLISCLSIVNWKTSNALFTVFLILCFSKTVALCCNRLCISALFSANRINMGARLILLEKYWEQGRFSFSGMLTSWVQNQGITPFLLLVAGPLIVGYFSLARLLTVPITVVNAGLINSALPRLRETYQSAGIQAVEISVRSLVAINMGLSAAYFLTLFGLHHSGVLDRIFPDYRNAVVFLVMWSVVSVTILYRSWLTQQYAVAMKFRFLLGVGIASATITYLFMGLFFLTTHNYYTVPVSVWMGECFLIVALLRQKASVMR